MNKKVIALAMTAILAMGSLTGCVTSQEAAESSSASAEASDENVLNVYTALEEEQVEDYLTSFKEAHPDVTVNVTRESTGRHHLTPACRERQPCGRCCLGIVGDKSAAAETGRHA